MYFAGTTRGIFSKRFNESIWRPNDYRSFNLNVTCFDSDSYYLYAGTKEDGIWRIPVSEITNTNDITSTPYEFALSPNYPNPFNPKTIINYSLSTSKYINLNVFDVLGNQVAELVNEKKPAGNYEAGFDGSNFPTGVYFYRLLVDGIVIGVKRMILLK